MVWFTWNVHRQSGNYLTIGKPFSKSSEPCANYIKAGYFFHNRTPILIQCVSWLVSFFFLRNPLFNGLFQHNLTKTGSAVTEKRLLQSLFHFIPLHNLTKGRRGVHFWQGGVHILIIPQKRKKESPQNRQLLSLPSCGLLLFMLRRLSPCRYRTQRWFRRSYGRLPSQP